MTALPGPVMIDAKQAIRPNPNWHSGWFLIPPIFFQATPPATLKCVVSSATTRLPHNGQSTDIHTGMRFIDLIIVIDLNAELSNIVEEILQSVLATCHFPLHHYGCGRENGDATLHKAPWVIG